MDLDQKTILKTKNMFALGIVYWLFDRELEYTESYIDDKFKKKKPLVAEANKIVLEQVFIMLRLLRHFHQLIK